ncbi:pyrroline-5-carboxylate reductase [Sphingomonas turrisvirgatae]|uniref:Pyrroline-5-carboxylate reductase n=1 Tax=Sphingomonas turrisvirgatae TaxID=1888892 RepID=A0A1E3LXU1_9SPHN|nr:pyrroline-5-carboxylate reductase [Sphingomonas turrisvirgatae]ODP38632.1 pyrroline-5-carboxylate reductase [Sphingomonas turrisvirgatae]
MSIARLWLIGCGNMAGAMLRRWIEAEVVAPNDVFVLDRYPLSLPAGVHQGTALPEGELPDAVMLGVKPQQLDEVAATLAPRLAGVPLLLSILAGVEEPALAARFDAGAIFRVMPNLPVAFGKGVVALNSASADDAARAAVGAMMAPLGQVEWIAADQFDAVTALASCGPAFVYRFIDAMAEGAAGLGLPADQALRLALATVEGAAVMAAASDDTPAVLADKVASPGGSTREGLNVLDADQALQSLLASTLAAAARRNGEMAAAARAAGERA